ncbi:MAG: hypothetical protein KA117_10370 [Verrucomicrobia bacterium]|nr:hypothetical protein [Verrucomicrobiota bacterium]
MRLTLLVLVVAVMCAGCGSVPPGTTFGITGDDQTNITGSFTWPVSTNMDLVGSVTGNVNTGAVTGGLFIVFKEEPSAATRLAMASAGMASVRVKGVSRIWLLPRWDRESEAQERALECALREGAMLCRTVKF